MKKIYNKLVHDRIPEIIPAEGRQYAIKILGDEDYFQALLKKLMEEVVAASPDHHVLY